MKKKILAIMMGIMLSISLVGCADDLILSERRNVDVTITEVYHTPQHLTMVRSGKRWTPITRPAVYRVYVEYNGDLYYVTNEDDYNEFKDKVGQIVTGVLEVYTCDNGKVLYDIVDLV